MPGHLNQVSRPSISRHRRQILVTSRTKGCVLAEMASHVRSVGWTSLVRIDWFIPLFPLIAPARAARGRILRKIAKLGRLPVPRRQEILLRVPNALVLLRNHSGVAVKGSLERSKLAANLGVISAFEANTEGRIATAGFSGSSRFEPSVPL